MRVALGPVERPDVAARAEQAELLRRPERHAHPRARRVRADRLGGLDQGGVAAAVVVDAGPARDRVEVAARHDDVVLVAARRLGDHVLRAAAARGRVDAHGRAAAVAVVAPSARVDTTTTGIRIPVAASVPLGTPRLLLTSSWMTRAVAPARSAFCALTREKHSPRSTSGIWPRSSPSKSEASQPRPDSRSVAGGAARAGVAQHLEVVRPGELAPADGQRRVVQPEVRERHVLARDPPPGVPQARGHVVGGLVVSRRARGPVAAVPVGDPLKRREMLVELRARDGGRRPRGPHGRPVRRGRAPRRIVIVTARHPPRASATSGATISESRERRIREFDPRRAAPFRAQRTPNVPGG